MLRLYTQRTTLRVPETTCSSGDPQEESQDSAGTVMAVTVSERRRERVQACSAGKLAQASRGPLPGSHTGHS